MSPSLLRSRVVRMQNSEDVFTLSVKNGHIDTNHVTYDSVAIGGSDERREGQIELIRNVAKWIPDFDAVYSIHDSPTRFISYMHSEELKELAEDGECAPSFLRSLLFLSVTLAATLSSRKLVADHQSPFLLPDLDPTAEMDFSTHGWSAACSPRSPARSGIPLNNSTRKSFIVDHVATMDICNHPEVLDLHGSLGGIDPWPQGELMPIFSLSKTNFHSDILGIVRSSFESCPLRPQSMLISSAVRMFFQPVEQFAEEKTGPESLWTFKTDSRLLWRGRNTGGIFSTQTPWRRSHRARLASMVDFDLEDEVRVLPNPATSNGEDDDMVKLGSAARTVKQGEINELMLDVGLAYEPIRPSFPRPLPLRSRLTSVALVECSYDDGTCDDIERELVFRPVRTFEEETRYKYILDVVRSSSSCPSWSSCLQSADPARPPGRQRMVRSL